MLPTYISRRQDKGRNLYVRMVAPTDVAPFLPKSERHFRQSLHTADVKEAARLAAPVIASKLEQWDKIRKENRPARNSKVPVVIPAFVSGAPGISPDELGPVERPLTSQLINVIISSRMHSWVAFDAEERPTQDDASFADAVAFSQMSEAELRKFVARGCRPDHNAELIELVLEAGEMLGVKVNPTDSLFPQLVRDFAIAERKIHSLFNERNKGEWPDEQDFLPESEGRPQLSEITELYRDEKLRSASEHYVSTGIFVWKSFIEFRGDVFFNEVTSKDIFDCMNHHLTMTERWSPQYLNKVKVYLDDIFELAITLAFLDGPNPIKTLKKLPQLEKGKRASRNKPRYPFTAVQINTLLDSEWYNPFAKQWRGQLSKDLGARYFMPLICILHGSRVREPLQLMTDEVVTVEGVLCFNFRIEFEEKEDSKDDIDTVVQEERNDEWPARSFKNSAVSRLVPVHPKLIELGFFEYIRERQEQMGKPGPLFSSALPEPGGKSPKYGRAYEQAMLRFMKDDLKFPPGFVNHSFRHGFEDRVRDANAKNPWPAGMWQHLTGRRLPGKKEGGAIAPVGSEEAYGRGYSPPAVAVWQATIDFSDIQFPIPYYVWKRDL